MSRFRKLTENPLKHGFKRVVIRIMRSHKNTSLAAMAAWREKFGQLTLRTATAQRTNKNHVRWLEL